MSHNPELKDHKRRFNLRLLERIPPSILPDEAEPTFRLSRRSFLGLSSVATLGQALPRLPAVDGFSLVRDGNLLHVAIDRKHRWTIDPAVFGPIATLRTSQKSGSIRIALHKAFFPGTSAPADFVAMLRETGGVWKLSIRTWGGATFRSDLVPWLKRKQTAVAKGSDLPERLISGLQLGIDSSARMHFTPDWTWRIESRIEASVATVGNRFIAGGATMHLLPAGAGETLANGNGHRILIKLERGSHAWPVELEHSSNLGWCLERDKGDDVFDTLHVEAMAGEDGPLHTAILSAANSADPALHFSPGAELRDSMRRPIRFPLKSPRILVDLKSGASTLVADLAMADTWVHAKGFSVEVGAQEAGSEFQLVRAGAVEALAEPLFQPRSGWLSIPTASGTSLRIEHGGRLTSFWTWANHSQLIQRALGELHLSFWEKSLRFDLTGSDRFRLLRYKDQLNLTFACENMCLHLPFLGQPSIQRRDQSQDATITAIFPPQHVTEQAYFTNKPVDETTLPVGPVETKNGTISTTKLDPTDLGYDEFSCEMLKPKPALPRSVAAGPSQLVFTVNHHKIPFTVEGLLDWNSKFWVPRLESVAYTDADRTTQPVKPTVYPQSDVADTHTPPDATNSIIAFNRYTAIELPTKLYLSPSEKENWQHEHLPTNHETEVFELWHSRLGLVTPLDKPGTPQAAPVTDPNAGPVPIITTGLTARAVWTDDFTNGIDDPLGDHFDPIHPGSEFRTSLDIRDRQEIVHLTSNRRWLEPSIATNAQPQGARPIDVEHLMLTPMGGYLRSFGAWNPGKLDEDTQKFGRELTVEQWRHIATLGRDHYTRVVYKCYCLPFTHRLSFVKVTERRLVKHPKTNMVYAVPQQHVYISANKKDRNYPLPGQPFGGRSLGFDRIELLTERSPDLFDPAQQIRPDNGQLQSQSLCWPSVNGTDPFKLNFRFHHKDGTHSDALVPVVLVGADVAQNILAAIDAVNFYNFGFGNLPLIPSVATSSSPGTPSRVTFTLRDPASTVLGTLQCSVGGKPPITIKITSATTLANLAGLIKIPLQASAAHGVLTIAGPAAANNDLSFEGTDLHETAPSIYNINNPWRRSDFGEKKVEFAPSLKSGDTEFDTKSIHWRAEASVLPGNDDLARQLYLSDLPYFYPVMHQAEVSSASSKRIAPAMGSSTVSFYPPYVQYGFDPKRNRGEVFLQVIGSPQQLSFGGGNQAVDKSGGIANPDVLVVGYSRSSGSVGGRRSDVSSAATELSTWLAQPASRMHVAGTSSSQSSLEVHANGGFDPMCFFGGMASARILGGLKLSDVVAPLLNAVASELGKPPQMLEQLLFDAEGGLDDLEEKIVNLINQSIQQLKFDVTLPNGTKIPEYPFRLRLASQAKAVNDAYALRVASGDDPIAHTQVITAVIAYSQALAKLVGNATDFARDMFLEALTNVLGAAYDNIISQLQIYGANLRDAIQHQAEDTLNQLFSALDAFGSMVTKQYLDPLVQKTGENVYTVFRQMEPDLAAICEVTQIVDDLRGRIRKLGDYTDPVQLIENIPPVLDDVLKIAERLGVLDAAQAATMTAAVKYVEDTAGKAFEITVDLSNSPLQGLIDASWVFADELSKYVDPKPQAGPTAWIDRARQALQAVAQLRQSAAQLAQGVTPNQKVNNADLQAWAKSQFCRRMQSNILAALQVLNTAALECLQLTPQSQALIDAANTLLTQFGDAASATWLNSILTTAADLNTFVTAVDKARSEYSDVLGAEQQALILGVQDCQTVSSAIAALRAGNLPMVQRTSLILAAQSQLFVKTLQLQAPFAAIRAYVLHITDSALNDKAIQALGNLQAAASKLIAWFNPVAETVCNTLKTFYEDWDALNKAILTIPAGEQALLKAIESQLDIVRKNFYEYQQALPMPLPSSGCPLSTSQAVHHLHQTLSGVNALLQATRKGVSNLDADGQVIVEQAKQLLAQLQGMIPHAVNLRFSFDWHPKLKSFEPVFLLGENSDLAIKAEAVVPIAVEGPQSSPSFKTTGTLTDFTINLIGNPSFVIVDIESFQFIASQGNRPDVHLKIKNVHFGEAMNFVEEIAALLNPKEGPFLDFLDAGVSAGFRFHVPKVQVGAFMMMQLYLNVGVMLPFNGDPVRCIFGVSDQDHPFLLAVSIYGGGGFLQLRLGLDGVERLEGALEFGIVAGVSIGPFTGWGYCVAGIYFRIEASASQVCGFVHAHGHMDIWGIVSMDVDLKVAICYMTGGTVQGIAEFEVDIDILFFSAQYRYRTTYQFAGHNSDSSDKLSAMDKKRIAQASACTVAQINPDYELTPQVWDQYLKRFSFAA